MSTRRWWCRIGLHWWKYLDADAIGTTVYTCRSCGVIGESPWT